jgi:hypothetical protein
LEGRLVQDVWRRLARVGTLRSDRRTVACGRVRRRRGCISRLRTTERLLLRVTLADAEGAQGSDARTVVVGDGLNVPPCPE